ncbi:helix-turn-helix domain-containing protein [Streptomyces niveus]|uniref:helix-turn-helix domain-containing protein n=1 Tax=Streptomyces niveus TaxID=193462 RepID=UPI003434D9FA
MFLQAARARRTPEQLGQEPRQGRGNRAAGPKKKVAGVRQEDMARKLQVSKATYQRMEGGDHKWTEPQVRAVVEALDLDPIQRGRFYAMTLGHYPTTAPETSWGSDTHLLEFVQSIPVQETRGEDGYVTISDLMCATDAKFDVVGHNPGFEILFNGGKVPDNLLEWGLQGGNGQLLKHAEYLGNEALLRVAEMRGTLGNENPTVQEFDQLIRSLPPSDPTSARPAEGLQEDIFPFKPPDPFRDGFIRSLELHLTSGTLGIPDGRKVFRLKFKEGPLDW